MARIATCKGCGKKINSDEKYIYSNKRYCEECYNKLLKEHEIYNILKADICKVFNIEQPTGLILKQIKDYKNQLKYTYGGMVYTLWYVTNIKRMQLDIKYGIAIIKYNYLEAQNYYISQTKIQNSVTNYTQKPTRVIKIGNISTNINRPKLINLDELIGDDIE